MELLASYMGYSSAAMPSIDIARMYGGVGVTVAIVVALYSLLQCYFGYIIFRVILVIQGVINGLGVGALIGAGIVAASGDSGAVPAIFIAAVICGIIGGIMAHFLYKFGVFCYFFAIFGIIGLLPGAFIVSTSSASNPVPMFVVAGILGVIGGILGVIFERYLLIWATGIVFGFLAGSAIGALTGVIWLGGILALVFMVTGIIVQLKMTKKKKAAAAVAAAGAAQQVVYVQNGQRFQQIAVPQGQPMYQQPQFQQAPQGMPQQFQQMPQYQAAPAPQMAPQPAPVPQEAIPEQQTCAKCGAPLEPGALFCGICGTSCAPAPEFAAAAPASAAPEVTDAPAAPVAPAEPVQPVQSVQPVEAASGAEEDDSESETILFTPSNERSDDAPTQLLGVPEPEQPVVAEGPAPAPEVDAPAFCPSCGAKLDVPGARFCGVCGNKIEF